MIAVSTLAQQYDYPPAERQALSVHAANQARPHNQHSQPNSDALPNDGVIQGEVIGKESVRGELQVRGVTLIGSPYRSLDALSTYRLHQTISPSTVKVPGEKFHVQA